MFKKGDDVMFWFVAEQSVTRGRGEVYGVKEYVVMVSWYGNRIISLMPENVFLFDENKYSEMKDDLIYNSALVKVIDDEITRLQNICKGD